MAERLFAERLALFAPRWQRAPSMFKLSSAKGRWGSCTQARVIRLSWRLLFAPLAVIDYVIAHELAHCLEMNHSAAFWVEVGRLYPDWAAQRAWLKQHGQYAPQW
jgi:predicted metal-dependent hydrolase